MATKKLNGYTTSTTRKDNRWTHNKENKGSNTKWNHFLTTNTKEEGGEREEIYEKISLFKSETIDWVIILNRIHFY